MVKQSKLSKIKIHYEDREEYPEIMRLARLGVKKRSAAKAARRNERDKNRTLALKQARTQRGRA